MPRWMRRRSSEAGDCGAARVGEELAKMEKPKGGRPEKTGMKHIPVIAEPTTLAAGLVRHQCSPFGRRRLGRVGLALRFPAQRLGLLVGRARQPQP